MKINEITAVVMHVCRHKCLLRKLYNSCTTVYRTVYAKQIDCPYNSYYNSIYKGARVCARGRYCSCAWPLLRGPARYCVAKDRILHYAMRNPAKASCTWLRLPTALVPSQCALWEVFQLFPRIIAGLLDRYAILCYTTRVNAQVTTRWYNIAQGE